MIRTMYSMHIYFFVEYCYNANLYGIGYLLINKAK